ncbi:aminotransferase class I/II-fold pyridoxal phosphate-dependent enzyme [Mucilaginibacter lacusdianchii]|uniref:aminotransferase class I/II-fold pyridoxal phosphate-dependent enzyme n=1 Tax=Mucilaginibacter lacusdianchii TaxID=2684211 RepID=UPI00131B2E25|nr:8-amino-7-oxononanoate synthase [Mucilaginibacter sp. JXJ CY 39]
MLTAHQYIQQKLDQRREDGIFRRLKSANGLIDFCSNDYLGLARSLELQHQIEQEIERHGQVLNGSTGSRLLAGNSEYAEQLETYIAGFHSSEAALLFNSGYDANLGLLSSLPQRGNTVIHDELIHASIIDGIRLSHANRFNFKHNDLESLESKLKVSKGTCYVVVESIYSMDGDLAPLKDLAQLVKKYDANLIVDEAHATGVFGKGLINESRLENEVFARIITYGKALGCHGAAVLGSAVLREYLINFARSFIYTTAAPFHQLASIKAAYQYLDMHADLNNDLFDIINYYTCAIEGVAAVNNSPIQTVVLGSNEKAVQLANKLQSDGFDVRPILNPTVPAGSERLRICLHTYNTKNEISQLTQQIKRFIDGK